MPRILIYRGQARYYAFSISDSPYTLNITRYTINQISSILQSSPSPAYPIHNIRRGIAGWLVASCLGDIEMGLALGFQCYPL